jgi:hypothetical protein
LNFWGAAGMTKRPINVKYWPLYFFFYYFF